jgi:glycosyltransferase involved in cell wall biosynthesis
MSTELSLVICTRNRAERLRACLGAVAEIRSARAWEIVVVDNASSDRTRAVLDEAESHLPAPLIVVSEPVPGLTRARNAGWRAASSAIVAFTDDDCYPAPDLISVVLDRFDGDVKLGFLAGAVLPHDRTDARVAFAAGSEPIEIVPGGFVTPGLVLSANLAFRRTALEAVEGFDPFFEYTHGLAGEDVDAAARVSVAGWIGRYDPDAIVHHHHGRKPGGDVDRVRLAYDLGRGAFFTKCALDPRLRRTYLGGWMRLTLGRMSHRQALRTLGRELRGGGSYLAHRLRVRGNLSPG